MSYFWKVSQCNMTFDLKINLGQWPIFHGPVISRCRHMWSRMIGTHFTHFTCFPTACSITCPRLFRNNRHPPTVLVSAVYNLGRIKWYQTSRLRWGYYWEKQTSRKVESWLPLKHRHIQTFSTFLSLMQHRDNWGPPRDHRISWFVPLFTKIKIVISYVSRFPSFWGLCSLIPLFSKTPGRAS